jgi:peroxiredoxin
MTRWYAAALSTLLLLAFSAHPVSAFGRLSVGDQLTDFRLPSLAGETVRLSQALGTKATLVVFWATWSPRSAEALAELQELYADHGPHPLGVIAVNVDGAEPTRERQGQMRSAIERAGVRYPVVIDERLGVYERLGVAAVPSIVLTDPSRRVIGILEGYATTPRFDFRQKILGVIGAAGAQEEATPSAVASDTPQGAAGRYLQMGRLYLKKGRREQAVKYLARAVAEDPGYAEACAELAELLDRMGRDGEAARVEAQLAHLQTAGRSGSLR